MSKEQAARKKPAAKPIVHVLTKAENEFIARGKVAVGTLTVKREQTKSYWIERREVWVVCEKRPPPPKDTMSLYVPGVSLRGTTWSANHEEHVVCDSLREAQQAMKRMAGYFQKDGS